MILKRLDKIKLMLLIVILLLEGTYPRGLQAEEDHLLFLPNEPVFERLIGDSREVQSYLIAQFNSPRYDGSIAATLELLQLAQKDGVRWGWGIEGDSFIEVESPGYGPYSLTSSNYFLIFPERVSDWHLGTYFSESSGDVSNRFEYMQVSSNLGDGGFKYVQGFVYVRQSFRFTTSFQPSEDFRLYAGVGYYPHVDPKEPPFFLHAGLELYTDYFPFAFGTLGRGYFTYDIKAKQEAGGIVNQNFEFGFQWKWKKDTHQAIRLALLYFNGNNEYGQFYRENDNHWSIGIFFDP